MNTEKLDELNSFIKDEIEPAIIELKNLTNDDSRKHLQKLVYTNLVDRFDYTIDSVILDNCRNDYLVEHATKHLDTALSEAELIKLLLNAETIQEALETKLKNGLRNSVLRERHSKKLKTLYHLFHPEQNEAEYWHKPRVNISTGKIYASMSIENKNIPYSICGYTDWLYSRRNSVVHGGANGKFLSNDKSQLKNLFKCTPVDNAVIKIGSVTLTAVFYKSIMDDLVRV